MLARLVSFQGGSSPLVTGPVLLAIAIGLLTQFVPHEPGEIIRAGISRLRPVPMGVAAAFALFAITTLGPRGVAPFIYFQF
jgi:hypothetical protein